MLRGWSNRARGLALLFVLSLCRACIATPAEAQADEVIVARVCWSEGRDSARECRAITHILSQRARLYGGSVRRAAMAYAPRATGRRQYVGREWIADLHPDRLPVVAGVNRELVRVRFAAIVMVAWRALRGMDPPICQRAWHWSAPWCAACRERMRVSGYRRLPCNGANWLWG
jgi:hypothetical protein